MPPDDHAPSSAPPALPRAARQLLLAVFVVFLQQFWVGVAAQFLLQSGFLASFYGPDFVALVQATADTSERQLAVTRMSLWAISVAFPFWAVSVVLTFRLIPGLAANTFLPGSGSQASTASLSTSGDEGITVLPSPPPRGRGAGREGAESTAASPPHPPPLSPEAGERGVRRGPVHRFGRNLLTGLVAWVVVTPLALGVNWLVVTLYQRAGVEGITEHPFTQVAQAKLLPAEWVPFVLAATLAAAVYEELLFRGILQPLFAGQRWGGVAAMTGALAMMLFLRWDRIVAAYRNADGTLTLELAPIWFVLATVPGFLAVWRFGKAPRAAGVYGTALLFAAIHATVWPSPVGLFVFAVGVGCLAEWTGSLVGPIVVHTLFNGVTCAWLFLQWVQAR